MLQGWWDRVVASRRLSYEPLHEGRDNHECSNDSAVTRAAIDGQYGCLAHQSTYFSWIDYWIVLWMGVYMLWAWNMFLAAGVYFQQRFSSNVWTASNFQSSILTVYCVTNLSGAVILARLQDRDEYTKRIYFSLILNFLAFTLLALSTVLFTDCFAMAYFVFVMLMCFSTALATSLVQNGLFSYIGGFNQPQYIQGIVTGQAVAGVLPCIVQIIVVLTLDSANPDNDVDGSPQLGQSPRSAFMFFITATMVSAIALLLFSYLDRKASALSLRKDTSPEGEEHGAEEEEEDLSSNIPLKALFKKLHWLALAVAIDFAVTMFFPIYTNVIQSVHSNERNTTPPYLRQAAFVPLALLSWNAGDLLGRVFPAYPELNLGNRPFVLLIISISRIIFIPLYTSCNVGGRGAWISSDLFYLLVVQFLFGLSNGYIAGATMMATNDWVEPHEREAAGGFMSMMLVAGLTAGSVFTFVVVV
ncbi:hypothetical protein KEM54_005631 [Ascosphaera aggregata]|nr:hypothetical protein KEM54_005631 [Ascosphaera aggregata]